MTDPTPQEWACRVCGRPFPVPSLTQQHTAREHPQEEQ